MSLRAVVRWGVLLVALAVVVLAAWLAWQAKQVDTALRAANDDALALRAAVESDNQVQADRALSRLRQHSEDAAGHTDGWSWSLLGHAPVAGDDARGLRTVSDVLVQLSRSGLEPLVTSLRDPGAFLPHDGRIPLDQLDKLRSPVAQADTTFASADRQLSGVDSSGFFGPLKSRYVELQRQVDDASQALANAHTALRLMPSMLGADGPRTYLLVFQNNAEIRSTGGMPGAVSLLHVDHGQLKLTKQLAGNLLVDPNGPVLPLTAAEQEIYGSQLGEYFLDANFTPDFPRAADLMRAHWERQHQVKVDGVVSIDPVGLSYLLGATGPVQVGSVSLTQDNVVSELLNNTYLTIPDPVAQDDRFKAIASAIFGQLTAGGFDARSALSALKEAADQHRLYVHSFHPHEDKILASTAVQGAVVTDPKAPPQVGMYVDDNTGSKMSYYLHYRAQVEATTCNVDVQTLRATATFTSSAPPDAATSLPFAVTGGGVFGVPAGSELVAVHVYGPVGGTVSGVTLAGKPVQDVKVVQLDGRPVATFYVFLGPAKSIDATWTMKTGPGQTGDTQVRLTPSIDPGSGDSVVPSAC